MNHWNALIAVLAAVYAVFLTAERLRALRDRKRLKHVIYVNGTRGKSTVTRLIDAGLRAGGFSVVSKSTGTLPVLFHTDGSSEIIHRRGPANIREQLMLLHLAAQENADVLVIECMALQRELQRISAHRMLLPDIGIITNARIDHTDVMGETREEILDTMMEMLPKDGRIFTAEEDLFPQIEKKAGSLHSRAVLTRGQDVDTDLDFPENVALALAVCLSLGAEREAALSGMNGFVHDPFDMAVFKGNGFTLVNAMSTNDVTSAKIVYEKAAGNRGEELVILINNRLDRPARAREMVRLCEELRPAQILLLGDQQAALKRLCEKRLPKTPVMRTANAEAVPFVWEQPTLMLAVGNIKNQGIRLYERAARELKQEKRGGTAHVS